MNNNIPIFFLASTESNSFRGPFKCWVEDAVVGETRNDYLLIRIEPNATDYRTKESLEKVLIVGRYEPTSLEKLPLTVNILKIKNPLVVAGGRCDSASVEFVTSGDIFPTFEEAAKLAETG